MKTKIKCQWDVFLLAIESRIIIATKKTGANKGCRVNVKKQLKYINQKPLPIILPKKSFYRQFYRLITFFIKKICYSVFSVINSKNIVKSKQEEISTLFGCLAPNNLKKLFICFKKQEKDKKNLFSYRDGLLQNAIIAIQVLMLTEVNRSGN
mgnify:CR=1 FL=1